MKKVLFLLITLNIILFGKVSFGQTVTTIAATDIEQTTATLNASASGLDASKTYYIHFYWGPDDNHYKYELKTISFTGSTSNSFSLDISDLIQSTQYYFTPYLYEKDVTPPPPYSDTYIGADLELSFTTSTLTTPLVTTTAASSITTTTVTIGGNVTSGGGATVTERGVCYSSVDTDPRIGDSNVKQIVSGSGTGTFTEDLTYLKPGVKYYFNAYAINSEGTAYGSPVETFTTTTIAQASNIAFSNTKTDKVDISVTAGGGDGRLLIAKQGASITQEPIDGEDYSGSNPTFGSGTNIGDNTFVIVQGNITSTTVLGLDGDTEYTFKVYEYTNNGDGGHYYQPLPATNSVTTLKDSPSTQASGVSLSGVTSTSMGVSWSNGNGDSRIVVARKTAIANIAPSDYKLYNANTELASGDSTGTGNYIVYNGSVANAGTITVTGLSSGVDYTFSVYEYNNSGADAIYNTSLTAGVNYKSQTTLNIATWQGDDALSPTDWNVSENWDIGEIPSSQNDVIIPDVTDQPVVSTTPGSYILSLTIESGATLKIGNGATLRVTGNAILKSPSSAGMPGTVVIPGTGILTVDGTSTIERHILTNNSHFYCPPITSQIAGDFAHYWVGQFVEADTAWHYFTSISDNLNTPQGYEIIKGTNASVLDLLSFSGTFNTGGMSIGVTNVGHSINGDATGDAGWNLVGNPYPSTINIGTSTTGLIMTNIDGTIHVYDAATTSYTAHNTSSTTDILIAPMQAFFVHVSGSSTGTFGVANSLRTTSAVNFKAASLQKQIVSLNISNSYFTTKTDVVFFEGATEQYDTKFDGYKLFAPDWQRNDTLAEVYTIIGDNTKASINTFPIDTLSNMGPDGVSFKLGFKNEVSETLTLSIGEIENIPSNIDVVLVDEQENIRISLLDNVNYQFNTADLDDNRFKLLFERKGATKISNKSKDIEKIVKFYPNPTTGQLVLESDCTDCRYKIYSSIGQVVQVDKFSYSTIIDISDIANGTYFIEFTQKDKRQVELLIKK